MVCFHYCCSTRYLLTVDCSLNSRIPDVHAKNADEMINTLQHSSVPPQIPNTQEKMCLPIQPSGVQIRSLSSGTQIHPLSSSSRQAPIHPLEVHPEAPRSQKQTTTSSKQWSDAQKSTTTLEPAPCTSRLPSEPTKGHGRLQALPTPPISCTNSEASTSEREEYSHRVGDERVGFLLFYFL